MPEKMTPEERKQEETYRANLQRINLAREILVAEVAFAGIPNDVGYRALRVDYAFRLAAQFLSRAGFEEQELNA